MVDEQSHPPAATPHVLTLSRRQRATMHRLLVRELSRCTTASLNTCERLGWISGLAGSYQLTETGRRIAEASEQFPPGRDLDIDLSKPPQL